MLRARQAVRDLAEYRPPLGSREGLRLDFNENTNGASPRVLQKLAELTADDLARYPEREPVERVVAEYLAVELPQVLLTNGVDEAIHLVCETYLEPSDELLTVVPTFALYEIYAGATGARVTTIQTNQDFRFPTDRLLAAITPQTRLIAIANPNNPTGALVSRADLLRVAKAAPDSAILVDEAYFEFSGETVIDAISEFPNLIVTRTFSKAYGLAGLRVGAIIAEREQTRMIRRVASPYNVNAAALVCVPEALADSEYIRDYVAQATSGGAALERELDCLGIRYWPSRANFVLAYFGEQAQAFVAAMRERGILVRDRERDPGCAGCVRITVGTTEHNERLLRELREVVAGLRSITTAGVSR